MGGDQRVRENLKAIGHAHRDCKHYFEGQSARLTELIYGEVDLKFAITSSLDDCCGFSFNVRHSGWQFRRDVHLAKRLYSYWRKYETKIGAVKWRICLENQVREMI